MVANDKSLGLKSLLPMGSQVRVCGCLYDGHWRLTWLLTSGHVGLIEVRARWSQHPR